MQHRVWSHVVSTITGLTRIRALRRQKKTSDADLKKDQWTKWEEYNKHKRHHILKDLKWSWGSLCKTIASVKSNFGELFPFRRPLRQQKSLEFLKWGSLFVYVQCDLVPVYLGEQFISFPPFSKNTNLCNQNSGPLRQEYAEKERLTSQLQRTLTFTFELQNGTIILLLLLFYLQLGMDKKLPIRWVNSYEMLQRPTCCWCLTATRRKPFCQYFCGNKEIDCQQFLWLSNHGSYSSTSYKIYDWLEEAHSVQQ